MDLGLPAPDLMPLEIVLNVDGTERKLRVSARVSLLDVLCAPLGASPARKGCEHGECGGCTVLVDGQLLLGCRTLAAMTQGTKIVTAGTGTDPEACDATSGDPYPNIVAAIRAVARAAGT